MEVERVMGLSLIVATSGKNQGQSIALGLPQFLIGRDSTCQLRPASGHISKRHCAVRVGDDGKAFVRDLESTNGTFVNGQRVAGEVELRHADHLSVGPLTFEVKLEAGVTFR
jgi:pSer/pThr/pTyr-binding forkhead associated (FHA) protein